VASCIFEKLHLIFSKDDDNIQAQTAIAAGSNSLLPHAVQKLIRMIFDIESMKKALLEFEVAMIIYHTQATCIVQSSKTTVYESFFHYFFTQRLT
jgi:hypothetical protein